MANYPPVQAFFAAQFEAAADRTQKDLADHVGVEEASVSRWVAGAARPKKVYWAKIASFFGVSREDVAAAVRPAPPTAASAGPILDAIAGATEKVTDAMEAVNSRLQGIEEALRRIEQSRPAARRTS